ncbi:MAG: hypothetical protein CMJ83_16890 [Planctomycetes bacterium]|nr:hypothetical protein [Planctomycetota bacterium]
MSEPLGADLAHLGPSSAGGFGGKAVNLSRMASDPGFATPAGTVVSRIVLRRFLDATGLGKAVDRHLEAAAADDAVTVERRFTALKARVLDTDLPSDLRQVLREAIARAREEHQAGPLCSGGSADLQVRSALAAQPDPDPERTWRSALPWVTTSRCSRACPTCG